VKLNEIGVKFLLCSGLFLAGGSMIIFAFMDLCPRGISYFILCVLTRATSAIGTSMSVSYAIVGWLNLTNPYIKILLADMISKKFQIFKDTFFHKT